MNTESCRIHVHRFRDANQTDNALLLVQWKLFAGHSLFPEEISPKSISIIYPSNETLLPSMTLNLAITHLSYR